MGGMAGGATADMTTLQHLLASVRMPGGAWLASADDPHAELLAMVWGSRFDRAHAQDLLAREPQAVPGVLETVQEVADGFDRLPASRQHRLRQIILRHRSRWDNRRHAPHPAD